MNLITQILEQEGSCRDINFDNDLELEGVRSLLTYLNSKWKFISGTDELGRELNTIDLEKFSSPSFRAIWEGGSIFMKIQSYMLREESGKYFIELSVFPQDLNQELITIDSLKDELRNLKKVTKSNQIFLRYENASWEYGDISDDVILSHLDL